MSKDSNDEFALKALMRSLQLYTPSMSEKPLAEYLASLCSDLGFRDVRIDEVGNLIATKGTGAPVTMLCGHMDTVPGKIAVKRSGDTLYGRGASDAKAPLLAMLFAAAAAKDCGTIMFVGAVDEEGNATGIKNISSQKLDINYAIFGEPSGTSKVTIAYKGRLAVSLRIKAQDSSHASAPWLSKNAIEEAVRFISRIKKDVECSDADARWKAVTATLTEISGGMSHNVTPNECRATIDIRIPVGTSCQQIEEKISKAVQEVSKERNIEAFHSILDETEPFEADHDSPLVRAFNLGAAEAGVGRILLIRKTGTGDMNVVGNRFSIPVVTYGPGDPHASHTANESVSVSEYLRGIEVLGCVLRHLKRLHERRRR